MRGQKPKVYCASIVGQVRELYGMGLTQSEVAQRVGLTQKVVFNVMRRHGIRARVAAKREQRGEQNSSWRGRNATYAAYHYRVKAVRGKASACDVCGQNEPSRRYDWANLTGDYADVWDYKQMCRGCHWKFDGTHRNFHGATGGRRAPR